MRYPPPAHHCLAAIWVTTSSIFTLAMGLNYHTVPQFFKIPFSVIACFFTHSWLQKKKKKQLFTYTAKCPSVSDSQFSKLNHACRHWLWNSMVRCLDERALLLINRIHFTPQHHYYMLIISRDSVYIWCCPLDLKSPLCFSWFVVILFAWRYAH